MISGNAIAGLQFRYAFGIIICHQQVAGGPCLSGSVTSLLPPCRSGGEPRRRGVQGSYSHSCDRSCALAGQAVSSSKVAGRLALVERA